MVWVYSMQLTFRDLRLATVQLLIWGFWITWFNLCILLTFSVSGYILDNQTCHFETIFFMFLVVLRIELKCLSVWAGVRAQIQVNSFFSPEWGLPEWKLVQPLEAVFFMFRSFLLMMLPKMDSLWSFAPGRTRLACHWYFGVESLSVHSVHRI